MANIRVVGDTPPPESASMADVMDAAAAIVKARGVMFCVLWAEPGLQVQVASWPPVPAAAAGLMHQFASEIEDEQP